MDGEMKQAERSRQLIVSGDGVFFTVQGEGPTMGEPAVFLRVNECNLTCSYCDTPYTWNRQEPAYRERRKLEIGEVVESIVATGANRCARLVITGGEPLLQQSLLAQVANASEIAQWVIEIETNGTIEPSAFTGRHSVQINCSPKLSNSNVLKRKRINPGVLELLSTRYSTYFKFVVSDESHLEEIVSDYMPHLSGLPAHRVYLSPEGIDIATIDSIRARLAPLANQYGFVMGDRQHIRLFGNKRRT